MSDQTANRSPDQVAGPVAFSTWDAGDAPSALGSVPDGWAATDDVPRALYELPVQPSRYRIRRAELAGDPRFPPVENGLDYLVSVVEHLESEDGSVSARNLKYAVLHLAAGTEVLLKARLQLEHWSLVFAQPGTATKQALEDGSFSSCSPEETRQRLTNIVGIPFNIREKKALSDLARSRNALQHYGLVGDNADAGRVETTTAQVLNFLIRFIETQLLPHLEDQERTEAEIAMERIRGGLHMIQSFVAERMRDLAPVLGPARNRTLQCPDCLQWALVASDGRNGGPTVECYFCDIAQEPHEFALGYKLYVVKHGRISFADDDTWTPGRCPDCKQKSLVTRAVTAAAPDTPVTFCFTCAEVIDALQRCQRCGYSYRPENEHHACPFDRAGR
ncbi:hypothetical protein [Streptomyces stackebrandtii]|uniref:hypothetical protein n=1 Tax=Streptomyces stackebrandtii TaxID=3051177 RepID=UPI0028DBC518|nr:hypothetical protein [Streptomyces sp. DSM 40976]